PGDTVSITLSDADASQEAGEPAQSQQRRVVVTLGERPNSERSGGFIGIKLNEQAAVPFDIDISLEDVGGPSAGMMFALAIVDQLQQGSLTAGHAIAGTGTIDTRGRVVGVGGSILVAPG